MSSNEAAGQRAGTMWPAESSCLCVARRSQAWGKRGDTKLQTGSPPNSVRIVESRQAEIHLVTKSEQDVYKSQRRITVPNINAQTHHWSLALCCSGSLPVAYSLFFA